MGECAAGALECGGLTPPWNVRAVSLAQTALLGLRFFSLKKNCASGYT